MVRWCGVMWFAVACGGPRSDGADDTDLADDTDAVEDSDLADDTDAADTDTTPEDTGPPLPDDPCVTSRPVVEVGTGQSTFVALVDGQELEMVNGPQGGWHINTAVTINPSPQYVRYELAVWDVETGVMVSLDRVPAEANIGLVPPVLGRPWACTGYYAGMEARLDFRGIDDDELVPVWQELCGRRLRISMSLRTPLGDLLGSDDVEIIVQPDPLDGPRCAPQ